MSKTIKIEELIELLQYQLSKGGKTVQYQGTLLVPERGNTIIITTEKQY